MNSRSKIINRLNFINAIVNASLHDSINNTVSIQKVRIRAGEIGYLFSLNDDLVDKYKPRTVTLDLLNDDKFCESIYDEYIKFKYYNSIEDIIFGLKIYTLYRDTTDRFPTIEDLNKYKISTICNDNDYFIGCYKMRDTYIIKMVDLKLNGEILLTCFPVSMFDTKDKNIVSLFAEKLFLSYRKHISTKWYKPEY